VAGGICRKRLLVEEEASLVHMACGVCGESLNRAIGSHSRLKQESVGTWIGIWGRDPWLLCDEGLQGPSAGVQGPVQRLLGVCEQEGRQG
jgi:hypothetical protein